MKDWLDQFEKEFEEFVQQNDSFKTSLTKTSWLELSETAVEIVKGATEWV